MASIRKGVFTKIPKVMKERWWKFHCSNLIVYNRFSEQVFRAINRGKNKVSAYQIMEWVRWEIYMQTHGDEFRINNNWIPFYARLFMVYNPEHKDIFNLRSGKHVGHEQIPEKIS